jgi:2-oxoglutarate/2-oxoacid ferredoxin oxidoreductase subunit alpha
MEVNIRIAGEAGQGVQTTGDLLVNAFADDGLHVFSTQSYMSRIRGGLNWYDVRVSDGELWGGREKCDILVALSK